MKYLVILFIVFGAVAPNTLLAQNNNRLSIQTGLFHYFFDKSPILNVNYPVKYNKLDIFNGLFLNSFGIQYERSLNNKSAVTIEYASFRQDYSNAKYPLLKPAILFRHFSTINISYSRKLKIVKHFDFRYGGGISYRHGSEAVVINIGPLAKWKGEQLYEASVEVVRRNDVGLHTFVGIDYTPIKWMTLYMRVNFIGFVYIYDKKQKADLKNIYDSPQFPTRCDLSLKFGLGFNFGK